MWGGGGRGIMTVILFFIHLMEKTIMKLFNKKTGVVVVAGLLALSGLAYAGSGHGHWDDDDAEHYAKCAERAERMVDRLDRELDLSDAQEQQVAAIVDNFVREGRAMRDSHKQAWTEAWLSDELSADDIAAMMDRGARRDVGKRLMSESVAALHAVLTPAQRETAANHKRFFSLMQGQGGKRGWHHGWH